jgi:uncharacterized protein
MSGAKFGSEAEFKKILSENIRPAQPIDTPDLLQGRKPILREIGRALASPGMHVFIHGERGIGKTSLALTAAKAHNDEEPPYVGCDEQSVFTGVVSDLCDALLSKKHLSRDTQISGSAGFNAGFFKAETKIEGSHKTVRTDNITTINQAANIIAECAGTRSGNTVVVLDELDRIKSAEAKSQIAELIKRIHDMRIGIKLVMCGIGKTLDEIIGSHLSASRAITPFELAPISFDARWEIVNNAAAKLGFAVDRKYLIRISQISDGFPYYIHLIAENLFWEVFDHREISTNATSTDFHEAITRAISRAEAPLREKYNYAIQKTKNSTDYEEALWAVAEGTHFERQLQDIYSKSYLKIMEHRTRKDRTRVALNIERFRTRLYSLCKVSHGEIVVRKRNSWYAFDENVIRGYVRLIAERAGVPLGSDHFAEADNEVS